MTRRLPLPTLRRIGGAFRLLGIYARNPTLMRTNHLFVDRNAHVDIRRGSTVRLGRGIVAMRDFTLEVHGGTVSIGDACFFNRGCHIDARDSIQIGEHCIFGERVAIHDQDHLLEPSDVPPARRGYVTAPVVVGDNVWVGSGAVILRGVTIGRGSAVAANAVVRADVPPRTLVAGVPARVIRRLD